MIFAVAMATFELLIDIATDRGLAVFIDDAQWVDGSTARVLSFLARRVAGDPIVLLMTLRDGHPSPILNADLDTIAVGPLPEAEAWQLLTSRRADLADSAARNVLRLAGGNPLALLELPADVREETSAETVSDKVHRAFLARLAALRPRRGLSCCWLRSTTETACLNWRTPLGGRASSRPGSTKRSPARPAAGL